MGSDRTRVGTRRRILAAGLTVGLLAGTAIGVSMLSGASSGPSGPEPLVLHAAPAVVNPDAPVTLTVGTFCEAPGSASCQVVSAGLLVEPFGAAGWNRIEGTLVDGVYRFVVPGELVPNDGFSYWIELRTGDGSAVSYPPGGAAGAVRVVTTAGLPVRALEHIEWKALRKADGTVARMTFGDAEGQVGVSGGGPEESLEGPSSFDVTPDGRIYVADWVNSRILVLTRGGPAVALPYPYQHPADLAIGPRGQILLGTLGTDASVTELTPKGEVVGRFEVGYGIATRLAPTDSGPRVLVGASQWAPVSAGRGRPLTAEEQAQAQTTSVPLPDGRIALSESLGKSALAFVWTRPDGSRGGAVVRLPDGVLPGSDYLVRPTADGGAIAARGLWDQTHYAVAALRFDAAGRIRTFSLLPAPSIRMAAHLSVVRFQAPDRLLVAYDEDGGIRIDRFEVR